MVAEVVVAGHSVDHFVDRSEDQQKTGGRWAWMLPCSVAGGSWLVLKESWQEVELVSQQRLL
jgi:hypothetical protein